MKRGYEIVKEISDKDCRALSPEFFDEFMPGGKYHIFVELVMKYHDELEFCFRGNNEPSEAVCIYYNNHLVYKIEANGNITINFDHARYSDYEKYWTLINHKYGFNKMADEVPTIKVTKKKEKGKISYYTSVGYITSKYNDEIKNNVENIYVNCIRKMLIDSFDMISENCRTDKFRAHENRRKPYRGKLPQSGRKKPYWIEKIRQQQIFSRMKFQKDGYFFYDMEFSQKSKDDSDEYKEALSNEPDMMAIHFNEEGVPDRFAFVEVKSTESAYNNKKSGMVNHLQKMKGYRKDSLKDRLREAALILFQYDKLGIYNIEVNREKLLDLADNRHENLFVFTDEAVEEFHKDKSEDIREFKDNDVKITDVDIHIPGCKLIAN